MVVFNAFDLFAHTCVSHAHKHRSSDQRARVDCARRQSITIARGSFVLCPAPILDLVRNDQDIKSPFGGNTEGINAGVGEHDWICGRDRANTDAKFQQLNPVDGKISGAGMND